VYQPKSTANEGEVLVTTSFKDAIAALNEGRKVLLSPDIKDISGITGKFVPVFWSPVHFPDQPGTMGLLMDPGHAAFRDFPTDFYSNWQWWDLCKNSKTVVLDQLTVNPIVTVIDNFFKNRKLGNVFEAKVGKGMLVFSSVDIHTDLEDRPVARQLKTSLINYMNSSDFKPALTITGSDVMTFSAETK
ncbi:MAG TPA: glycoside hydrolase family 2, partial [Bacteroidales bacterium]|nr:glycoside hydrolase family 2 [Bacteroidales bacterium]